MGDESPCEAPERWICFHTGCFEAILHFGPVQRQRGEVDPHHVGFHVGRINGPREPIGQRGGEGLSQLVIFH